MKKVAIIILNWNSEAVTIDCLNSLLQISYPEYKIFLIDNGSKESSYSIEDQISSKKIQYIRLKFNYGFTGGNNIGINIAIKDYDPDYFLLLNNDTLVDSEFLSIMVRSFETNSQIGIVVPKIFFYEPNDFIYYAGGYLNLLSGLGEHYHWMKKDNPDKTNILKEVSFANGCSMLIKKEVVQKVGLLDDDYFANVEDVDYSYRVTHNGYKILYNPGAFLWHREGFASRKNVGQWFRNYLTTRNVIIFERKKNFLTFLLFMFYFSARWVLYMELKHLFKRDYKSCKAIFYGIADGFTKKLRYLTKPDKIEFL
jgi:GT2 family glycosyltransferase